MEPLKIKNKEQKIKKLEFIFNKQFVEARKCISKTYYWLAASDLKYRVVFFLTPQAWDLFKLSL